MIPPLSLLFFLLAVIPLHGLETLRSLAEVRALSREEAALSYPVEVEATVIYFDPLTSDVIVHDGTAGCYIGCPVPLVNRPEIRPGARVRITGVSNPASYFPDVIEAKIEILSQGELPVPRRVTGDELYSRLIDSDWVEVPATVVGVEKGGLAFTLVVEIQGALFKADMPKHDDAAQRALGLMQKRVLLRGVVGTVSNEERQLTGRHFFVPSFDEIIPLSNHKGTTQAPLRKINEFLRSDLGLESMVRVRGIVTQLKPNGLYLRDESGNTFLYAAVENIFSPGSLIEAVGYPSVAPFRPELRTISIKLLEKSAASPPPTRRFDPSKDPLLRFHYEKVGIDCSLLGIRQSLSETILQCRTGSLFFEAHISALPNAERWLNPGDTLNLTGICEVTTTHPMPRPEWADGFRLHLAGNDSITVLSNAPWWTLQRVLVALGLAISVMLAAFVWNWMLRRRVAAQSEIITRQIKTGVIKDERQRIARELHDTVEQELTGLSMQMGNLAASIGNGSNGATASSLDLARRMLRRCRQNSRAAISDLRNNPLLYQDLPTSIRETLSEMIQNREPNPFFQIEGEPFPLPGTTENHLIRIIQESVANSYHHSGAENITVHLAYYIDRLTLEIRDDGSGFEPCKPLPLGHFGLLGIYERANKIEAEATITSSPGKGCIVCVCLNRRSDNPEFTDTYLPDPS